MGNTGTDTHVPRIGFLPQARIAESRYFHSRRRRVEHWPLQLVPCAQVRMAGCRETLRFTESMLAIAQRCITCCGALYPCIEHGRDALEIHRTTAETTILIGTSLRRRQRNGHMLPMHHVRAGCVRPVHITPDSRVWIVLVEHVVATLPENRPVRIIHPVRCRQ